MKNLRDILNESCGLAGAVNIPLASKPVVSMGMSQQHRGEAGTGCCSSDGENLYLKKDKGLIKVVFPRDFDYKKNIPGDMAIFHNRYATRGSVEEICNVQPLLFKDSKFGQYAIGHNGQLIDVNHEKDKMLKGGAIFQSTTDSEILAHLIAKTGKDTIEEAIASEIVKIPSAYSVLIMTPSKLIALRDKFGVRPLSIAQMGEGYLVASETAAFRIFEDEAKFIRHINPGEMVIFDRDEVKAGKGFRSIQYVASSKDLEAWCIFEGIYFSDPRSEHNGYMHEDFRQECGRKVYEENKQLFEKLKMEFGDKIAMIPMLDSGKQGSIGFSKASGIPYKEYFMRRHNAPQPIGRSYTAAYQEEREMIAKMKSDLRSEKVNGICAITGDDSEVRGTTITSNNKRLRKSGAKYIVNVVFSPMLRGTCREGMDHQTSNELIAHQCDYDLEKISKSTGADITIYLTPPGLHELAAENYRSGICSGCFGGRYTTSLTESK